MASKSSFLPYSNNKHSNKPYPWCELMLQYLAVPTKLFPVLYGICIPVLLSLNFFANPKSMIYIKFSYEFRPNKKFSGLMSRCKKFLLWRNSILDISWSAINRTVFKLNFFPQKLNKSSKEGPSKSNTIAF